MLSSPSFLSACHGSLVEISGDRSSGRFAFTLAALAAATAAGGTAALIDLGDHLDPQAAVDAGVELKRVLWARPAKLRDALAAAEMALTAGFTLVAADLGSGPLMLRGAGMATNSFLRLARAAEVHGAVALVVSPYPMCGPAARTRAVLERATPLWDGNASPLLSGIAARLSLRHRKQSLTHGTIRLSFDA